jgi:hypothetical protein
MSVYRGMIVRIKGKAYTVECKGTQMDLSLALREL